MSLGLEAPKEWHIECTHKVDAARVSRIEVSVSTHKLSQSGTFTYQGRSLCGALGDGFVTDAELESWRRTGVLKGNPTSDERGVLVLNDGRRFVASDAVRVLGRRDGDSDPYSLTGRVMTLRNVLRRGGILGADGLRLGPAIYDVSFGALLLPVEDAEEEASPNTERSA